LKKYRLFENHADIHRVCKEYGIENYTINSDGTIDVVDFNSQHGSVELDGVSREVLTKLPLKFNQVSGNFYCSYNQLTSLEGAPLSVGGDFYCRDNKLTSLEGAPKHIGGVFNCNNNQLTSLEGAPLSVGGTFDCSSNQLTSLEGAPKHIGDYFDCDYNKLTNLDHLPNISNEIYMAGNPVYSIVYNWIKESKKRWEKWEYFQDLNIIQGDKVILERLEEFHEVMEIPLPDLEEIKKYYKIIE